MKHIHFLFLAIFFTGVHFASAQLPDLKNVYTGRFNFDNCISVELTDSACDTVLSKSECTYDSDGLPETIIWYTPMVTDSIDYIYSFAYLPSAYYFLMITTNYNSRDTVITYDKIRHSPDGKITVDSCYNEDMTQLTAVSNYTYSPEGWLAQVTKEAMWEKDSRIITADTATWTYDSSGQVDSLKEVNYIAGEFFSMNIYKPVYGTDGRIEKSRHAYWEEGIGYWIHNCYVYTYEQTPITMPVEKQVTPKLLLVKNNALITFADNVAPFGYFSYDIFTMSGRQIYQSEEFAAGSGSTSITIPMNAFRSVADGQYMLQLTTGGKKAVFPFYLIR